MTTFQRRPRVAYVTPAFMTMNLAFYAFVIIMIAFALICAVDGCAASADEQYRAKILLCVERATTLLESKACRRNVDFQFGVHDGGVE